MHFYETRLYKLWYFETNACAVMSWEPRMLQESWCSVCETVHACGQETGSSVCLRNTHLYMTAVLCWRN